MHSLAEASEATRALQLLRNTGDSLSSPDAVPKLQALFPRATLPLPRRHTEADPHNSTRHATNFEDFKTHVATNLAKHPKLAGTGPLPTAYEHLEGIADTGPCDLLDLYAGALYDWVHGDVHEDITTLHLSGLLSAKAKANGGVRPLVAGSVHRRIAMRAILAVHKTALVEILGQEQYGMGERAAVEKMFRFVESAVHEHTENVVMAIDMVNAFNSMQRGHIMDEVARLYPTLLDTA